MRTCVLETTQRVTDEVNTESNSQPGSLDAFASILPLVFQQRSVEDYIVKRDCQHDGNKN